MVIEKYEVAFRTISERYLEKVYKHYRKDFSANAIDIDDLKQEAKIKIWEIVNKHPDKDIRDIKGLIISSVSNMVRDILRRSRKISSKMIYPAADTVDGNGDKLNAEETWIAPEDIKMKLIKSNMFFEDLRTCLTEVEYQVIEGHYLYNKSVIQLTEELGYKDRIGVYKVIDRAMAKLKKKFLK